MIFNDADTLAYFFHRKINLASMANYNQSKVVINSCVAAKIWVWEIFNFLSCPIELSFGGCCLLINGPTRQKVSTSHSWLLWWQLIDTNIREVFSIIDKLKLLYQTQFKFEVISSNTLNGSSFQCFNNIINAEIVDGTSS